MTAPNDKRTEHLGAVGPGVLARVMIAIMFAVTLALSGASGSALARQDDWVQQPTYATRVLVGAIPSASGVEIYAGVQVKMEPGWKTYWHNPGDAGGIPPHFDWTRSTNVAAANVRFPTPARMTDETGTTFGYKDGVTFPVQLVPVDPSQPMVARLTFNFGVCDKICVPAFAEHEIRVNAQGVTSTPIALTRALQSLPETIALDAATGSGPRVTSVRWGAPDADGSTMIINVRLGADQASVDVFPALPSGVFLGIPNPSPNLVSSGGKGRDVAFEIDVLGDASARALAGQPLTLTLAASNGGALEQTVIVPQR